MELGTIRLDPRLATATTSLLPLPGSGGADRNDDLRSVVRSTLVGAGLDSAQISSAALALADAELALPLAQQAADDSAAQQLPDQDPAAQLQARQQQSASEQSRASNETGAGVGVGEDGDASSEAVDRSSTQAARTQQELTPEQQQQVEQLQARDREVRAHEQAHKAVAGGHARGGPFYEFQSGPDGQQYAVGGYVNIDTSEEGTPEATLVKAEVVRRAALAPAEPSAADRAIAADALKMAANAQIEIRQQAQVEVAAAAESAQADQDAAFARADEEAEVAEVDQSNRDDDAALQQRVQAGQAAFAANVFAQQLGFAS